VDLLQAFVAPQSLSAVALLYYGAPASRNDRGDPRSIQEEADFGEATPVC
jgi:hypothetical protein